MRIRYWSSDVCSSDLHGKNFCAATWESAIAALAGAGFRVVAVDQVGFCKSSKPHRYQSSFGQLADNKNALLQSLRIERAKVVRPAERRVGEECDSTCRSWL